ncbi:MULTISPECIES: TetR/AcrR family transcriptional regulator [Microbacterium]|uniref:TetR/AcrR family transcriptional regulator n=1 Tax=Microbacterium TaxID=33882 RepID=UPI001D1722F4|nr:TetR/AcrR family transcriptional regulator [Microbacterium testaceum]MCC4247797.1 TetR/AcrR family transcriptional regulator [Microbacterium testaceum]
MEQKRTRGPYAKSAAQRQNILAAARRTFAQLGYSGASMRGIAEEAGITFTGLRHHFATKDELLVAVLTQRDEEHQAQQADIHGTDFLNALGALLHQTLDEPAITEIFTTVSGEAVSPDHPAHEFFTRRYERVRREFSTELDPGVGEPAVVTIAPENAAILLAAVMDGLQLQWLLDESVDVHGAFADFIGLLRPPPASDGSAT